MKTPSRPVQSLAASGLAALLCGVASPWACAQTVVKIGHVAPISGPQAHYGRDNENGARMAID